MTLPKNFLVTDYRFAMSPMYKIGDHKLMSTVSALGVTPGILTYNITKNEITDLATRFDVGLVLGVNLHRIKEDKDKLMSNKSFVQLRRSRNNFVPIDDGIINTVKEIQQHNKIIIKDVSPDTCEYWGGLLKIADAFELCDSGGAGVTSNYDYKSLAKWSLELFPDKTIIATGNISSRENIQERVDVGYASVLLGTLFALCEECEDIPMHTKIKMLQKNSISRVNNQNLIVLGEVDTNDDKNHNNNYQRALECRDGMIYGSQSLSNAKIQSLQDLIKDLS